MATERLPKDDSWPWKSQVYLKPFSDCTPLPRGEAKQAVDYYTTSADTSARQEKLLLLLHLENDIYLTEEDDDEPIKKVATVW